MDEARDYYRILQVDRAAETEVIQAAYRRLARKYHPDVNPSIEATQVMKRLNEAFEILGDPIKRANYDRQLMGRRDSRTPNNRPQQKKSAVVDQFQDAIKAVTDHLPADVDNILSKYGETQIQRSFLSSDKRCVCSQCNYVWKSKKEYSVPARCPKCRSDMWNRYRVFQCQRCGARFISRVYSVEAYRLFPKCPGCQAPDWHIQEETRKKAELEARKKAAIAAQIQEETRKKAELEARKKAAIAAQRRRDEELKQMALRVQKVSVNLTPIAIVVFSFTFVLVIWGLLKLLNSVYDWGGYLLIVFAALLLVAFALIILFFESREKMASTVIAKRLDRLVANGRISLVERRKIEQYIREFGSR